MSSRLDPATLSTSIPPVVPPAGSLGPDVPPGGGLAAAPPAPPDMAECLRDIPLDWLADAANLLRHTLSFAYNPGDLSAFQIEGDMGGELTPLASKGPPRVPPGKEFWGPFHKKIPTIFLSFFLI